MKFLKIPKKLKIWDGTKVLDVLEEGDSAAAKGLLVFGKDTNGNVIPLRIIAEGDDLTGLEGILSLGKDVNGNALPLSIVADGDSTTGLKGIYLLGENNNGDAIPIQVDEQTKALISILEPHAQIHGGKAFFNSGLNNIANAADFDILLKNPVNNESHFRFNFSVGGAPMVVRVFENPTITDDGTGLTVFNVNRNSVITNKMTLFSGPTLSDDGTELECLLIAGARQEGGTGNTSLIEWELKVNEDYLLRITNNAGGAQDVCHNIFWYEL